MSMEEGSSFLRFLSSPFDHLSVLVSFPKLTYLSHLWGFLSENDLPLNGSPTAAYPSLHLDAFLLQRNHFQPQRQQPQPTKLSIFLCSGPSRSSESHSDKPLLRSELTSSSTRAPFLLCFPLSIWPLVPPEDFKSQVFLLNPSSFTRSSAYHRLYSTSPSPSLPPDHPLLPPLYPPFV